MKYLFCLSILLLSNVLGFSQIDLRLSHHEIDKGEEILMEINISNFINISSFSFQILFDTSQIQYIESSTFTVLLPDFNKSNISFSEDGHLTCTWTGEEKNFQNTTQLFLIALKNLGDFCSTNEIIIQDPIFQNEAKENLQVNTLNGIIDVKKHPSYDELMMFYDSLGGSEWLNNYGWKEGKDGENCNPCGWFGINCNENNQIDSITLNKNNLEGRLVDLNLPELLYLSKPSIKSVFENFTGCPSFA